MRATWCGRRRCREPCDVLNHAARRVPHRRANLIECRAWAGSHPSFRPTSKRCRRSLRRRAWSATRRLPSATRRCRKSIACGICCANCSVRSSAGVRRSSIPSSCFWPWKISSKPLPATRPPMTKDLAAARARGHKRRANRGALPAHLPHVDVTIAPEDTNCPCCRAPMHVIGEEPSRRPDAIPAQFRVIVTHRPKDACRACEQGVVQAPAPERLIKGGLPTEAMVAYVLVAKYAWHLPLYRQAQMLMAQGLDIKRAILAFWVGYAAAELQPLYVRLRELILTAGKIAVDETVAPVLDPGRGRTKKGYFWAIARDDRPWGGTDPPAVAYTYAPGRGAVHALKLLDHYRGVVQCDGYAAYKTIANAACDEAITLAFCWAHLRRRFFDIAQGGPAPIASEALARIAALYAIEKTIRGKSAGERRAVRQERSKPLVLVLKAWLDEQLTRVSGKSLVADAIRYGLNHWDGLTRFLDDGRIELDTNIVERGMRP